MAAPAPGTARTAGLARMAALTVTTKSFRAPASRPSRQNLPCPGVCQWRGAVAGPVEGEVP